MALKPKDQLLQALAHVELVARGPASYAPYCQFAGGWLIGYDGIVAAGMTTPEQLMCAPDTEKLRKAIIKAGEPYSLTVINDGKLRVRGDKFRAEIAGMSLQHTPNVFPDTPVIPAGEMFRRACIEAAKCTSAKDTRVIGAAVLVRDRSAVGTNGHVVVEARHDCFLSHSWLLPSEMIATMQAVKDCPTAIGHSPGYFTLWFGENKWLRCQTYAEDYPDTDIIFARNYAIGPVWHHMQPGLAAALDALKPFLGEDRYVKLGPGYVACDLPNGASVALPGEWPALRLPWSVAAMMAGQGEWLGTLEDVVLWQSEAVRGIARLREDRT